MSPSFRTFKPPVRAIVVGYGLGFIILITVILALEHYPGNCLQCAEAVPVVELGELHSGTSRSGNHWFNLSVTRATVGLTPYDFGFKIVSPNGFSVRGWNVTLNVGTRALATYEAEASSWSSVFPVNTSDVMVFYTGSQDLVGSNDTIYTISINGANVAGEYGPL